MTWLDSFSYCSLASEDSLHYLADGIYRGWGGGIYLNSQWMVNKGNNTISRVSKLSSLFLYKLDNITKQ